MKRSGVFITVLLSLFMFQSLWNVAAAFCDHEPAQASSNIFLGQHFGHHQALNCSNDQQQHQMNVSDPHLKNKALDEGSSDQLYDFLSHLNDDHSDHLPSLAHFIVADVRQQADLPKLITYPESTFIDWKNLYQSPHLYLPNPPPVLSPL